MRTLLAKLTTASALLLAVSSLHAQDLQHVLSQLDAASAKFQSAQADFKWDTYERIVRETSTQTGKIYFLRKNGSVEMGGQILTPAKKTVSYSGGTFKMYEPSVDQLTVLDSGKNKAQFESFLTLGFGGSGADLAKTWNITYQGTETIDGVSCAKLDLVSKTPSPSDLFTHITIWVDPIRDVLLKQQFFESSGDQRTNYFTNIKLNSKVDTGSYAIKTTGKTTVKHP